MYYALTQHVVTVDAYWLDFVVGTILPIVVAIIKKRYSSSAVGAILLIVLAAADAIGREVIGNDGTFDLYPTLMHFFVVLITAVGAHYGFLKPFQITGSNGVVQKAIPGGIGSDRIIGGQVTNK